MSRWLSADCADDLWWQGRAGDNNHPPLLPPSHTFVSLSNSPNLQRHLYHLIFASTIQSVKPFFYQMFRPAQLLAFSLATLSTCMAKECRPRALGLMSHDIRCHQFHSSRGHLSPKTIVGTGSLQLRAWFRGLPTPTVQWSTRGCMPQEGRPGAQRRGGRTSGSWSTWGSSPRWPEWWPRAGTRRGRRPGSLTTLSPTAKTLTAGTGPGTSMELRRWQTALSVEDVFFLERDDGTNFSSKAWQRLCKAELFRNISTIEMQIQNWSFWGEIHSIHENVFEINYVKIPPKVLWK